MADSPPLRIGSRDVTAVRRAMSVVAVLAPVLTTPVLPVAAQVGLNGRVVDESGNAIAGAVVAILDTGDTVSTGARGGFVFEGLTPGRFRLVVISGSHRPRMFNLVLEADDIGQERSVGDIVLVAVDAATVLVLQGRVFDERSGEPVVAAGIQVGSMGRTATDSRGFFRVEGPRLEAGTRVEVAVQRIGYQSISELVTIPADTTVLDVAIRMLPSPFALEEITVEGRQVQVPSYLRGFYGRRETGQGTYFTAEQIERMHPFDVSDVLRRVPGLAITGGDGPFQDKLYRFSRSGPTFRSDNGPISLVCQRANLFVDGVRVLPEAFDILADPGRLAGLEVYSGGAVTPPPFDVPSGPGGVTGCGAIVAWTRAPDLLPDGTSRVDVGVHVGGGVNTARRSGMQIGAQLAFPVGNGLELNPGFTVIREKDGDDFGSGWQAYAALRGFPLGESTPWYVGGGFAVLRYVLARKAETYLLLVSGLRVQVGRFRPFAEAQAVDPLRRGGPVVHLRTGLSVSL